MNVIWPGLITRYVIFELLKVFLVALAVLTCLMTLVGVAQEAVRQGLGPTAVLRLIPFAIPNALVFALPGTILFSACSVFGRMSAANEITAIKSLGISPTAVTRPALVLAFVLSLCGVWLTDLAFCWGYHGMRQVVVDSIEEVAYGLLRTQRTYSTPQFSISVASVEGQRLIQPAITIRRSDEETLTLTAREARLRCEPREGVLKVMLTDGVIEMGDETSLRFADTVEHTIPLTAHDADASGANPSHLLLREIRDEVRLQNERIAQIEKSMAADAAFQLILGDLRRLVDPQWSKRQAKLNAEQRRLHRLETEPYRRWAGGFSCLAFVTIGIPLAIRLRASDVMTTFGVCFLPILLAYYPLFAFGLDRAKSGALPPYFVWCGNVVCLAIGLWLFRRVNRN
ncbi:MAG: LptF/LptG family permease [Pirellulaceae bacterium]